MLTMVETFHWKAVSKPDQGLADGVQQAHQHAHTLTPALTVPTNPDF